jgi:hypothetical protein
MITLGLEKKDIFFENRFSSIFCRLTFSCQANAKKPGSVVNYFKFRVEATVTRRFVKKSAQLCPNIAQTGALLNNNFCPKKSRN